MLTKKENLKNFYIINFFEAQFPSVVLTSVPLYAIFPIIVSTKLTDEQPGDTASIWAILQKNFAIWKQTRCAINLKAVEILLPTPLGH